jgi:hypothetical protein
MPGYHRAVLGICFATFPISLGPPKADCLSKATRIGSQIARESSEAKCNLSRVLKGSPHRAISGLLLGLAEASKKREVRDDLEPAGDPRHPHKINPSVTVQLRLSGSS